MGKPTALAILLGLTAFWVVFFVGLIHILNVMGW